MKSNNKLNQNRRNRINELKSLVIAVNEKGQCASYKKTIAHYSLITGTARRTVIEYLNLLIDAEIITKHGDDMDYVDGNDILK